MRRRMEIALLQVVFRVSLYSTPGRAISTFQYYGTVYTPSPISKGLDTIYLYSTSLYPIPGWIPCFARMDGRGHPGKAFPKTLCDSSKFKYSQKLIPSGLPARARPMSTYGKAASRRPQTVSLLEVWPLILSNRGANSTTVLDLSAS